MVEEFISLFQTDLYRQIFGIVWALWPIYVPLAAFRLFIFCWFGYKRRKWIHDQGSVLLEIKLPREILRTPQAMELVLNGMFVPSVGSGTDVFINGRIRDWFSLEMVSIGGEVKFYIWALAKWKKILEARIYAEYPGVEIFEVPDYALDVNFNPKERNLWGITTALNKPDAYPIKTYIDYELDKEGTESEETVDPIMPIIEYLGSLKPGEQAWVQILIRGHRKEKFISDAKVRLKPDWKEGIKKEIKKIIEEQAFIKQAEGKPATLQHLTSAQDDTIKSIERNAGKLAFDSMIRVLYTAPLDVYDGIKAVGLIGSFRQFGSETLNSFRPNWITAYDYPWEDFNNIRKNRNQRELLDAYKRRSFFDEPYKNFGGTPYVLTTEELATLFHFPGAVVSTPTLTRVPSKKSEAPSNLPL